MNAKLRSQRLSMCKRGKMGAGVGGFEMGWDGTMGQSRVSRGQRAEGLDGMCAETRRKGVCIAKGQRVKRVNASSRGLVVLCGSGGSSKGQVIIIDCVPLEAPETAVLSQRLIGHPKGELPWPQPRPRGPKTAIQHPPPLCSHAAARAVQHAAIAHAIARLLIHKARLEDVGRTRGCGCRQSGRQRRKHIRSGAFSSKQRLLRCPPLGGVVRGQLAQVD